MGRISRALPSGGHGEDGQETVSQLSNNSAATAKPHSGRRHRSQPEPPLSIKRCSARKARTFYSGDPYAATFIGGRGTQANPLTPMSIRSYSFIFRPSSKSAARFDISPRAAPYVTEIRPDAAWSRQRASWPRHLPKNHSGGP